MVMPNIDLAKLRSFIRRLDREHHLMLLDRAIELLPASDTAELVRDIFPLDELSAHEEDRSTLDEVRAFHVASLHGEFFEDFLVNSRNCTTRSRGTASFIAECHRLFRLLGSDVADGQLRDAREGFELMFDLLRQIDLSERDIVFFADEAGAWQIGVQWNEVLPAWFRCVAAEEDPETFASVLTSAIEEFAGIDRCPLLIAAAAVASSEQAAALRKRAQVSTDRGER